MGRHVGWESVRSVRKGGRDGQLAYAAQREMRYGGLPPVHDLIVAQLKPERQIPFQSAVKHLAFFQAGLIMDLCGLLWIEEQTRKCKFKTVDGLVKRAAIALSAEQNRIVTYQARVAICRKCRAIALFDRSNEHSSTR
jgi:hypothetical protein